MSDVVLECNNLCKSFKIRNREIAVLKGVNFRAHSGEIVVIRGKSGAGKSVLLWLLSGLDRPTCGEVLFEGRSLESGGELARMRREKMGIIFQNFNLVSSWTALENVESALRHNKMPKEVRWAKAAEILAELGFGDYLDNLPAELSVGQQQLVAVARTLINEPKLILADEPTGDVDSETAQDIIEMLVTSVKERRSTLIVATHGGFPLSIANRVLWLRDGILALGDTV